MQTTEQIPAESVGSTVDPSVSVSGVQDLHQSLDEIADSFDVTGFKCPNPECGLAHMHDTTKHRLSDTFDVSESVATEMTFNPVCHCGVHEASLRGSEFGVDESRASRIAGDAPIPTETERAMTGSNN